MVNAEIAGPGTSSGPSVCGVSFLMQSDRG